MNKNLLKILCAVMTVVLLSGSLTGCGKKKETAEEDNKNTQVDTADPGDDTESKAEAPAGEEKKEDVKADDKETAEDKEETIRIDYPFEERFVYGDNNLFYIEDDGSLTCHFKSKEGQNIEYGTGGDGYFFFLTRDSNSKQELYFLDENFELSYTPIEYPENMYVNCISYYDGKVYYSGYDRDVSKNVICFYDPHGDAFSDDPEMNRLLRFFENYKGRGLDKLVASFDIVRDLEKTGYIFMSDPDTKDIYVFDKDTNEVNSFKKAEAAGVYQTRYYGPGYLVSEVDDDPDGPEAEVKKEKPDGQEYILYDYETGEDFSFKIGKDQDPQGIVDIRDGYVYYYEGVKKDDLDAGRSYKRLLIDDIKAGNAKPEEITFAAQYPCVSSSYGSYSEGNNIYDAFSVKKDRVYYLSYDNDGSDGRRGDVVWRSLPLSDPSEKNIQKTGATERHEDFSDFGYIKEEADSRTDKSYEDFVYYYGYYQSFRFYDDIENADRINKELERVDESFAKSGDSMAEQAHKDIIEEGEEGNDISWFKENIGMGYTYNKTFSGVNKIRDSYVQVSFDDYSYYGGAHGSGYSYHYLFDLKTGERKTLKDLYKGTEDEFKKLALSYSLDSWKNDGEYYYFEYNGSNEAEMKENFLSCISLDMDVAFDEHGVDLIYPPYAVGPYASGEIKVRVPYYALDIYF